MALSEYKVTVGGGDSPHGLPCLVWATSVEHAKKIILATTNIEVWDCEGSTVNGDGEPVELVIEKHRGPDDSSRAISAAGEGSADGAGESDPGV